MVDSQRQVNCLRLNFHKLGGGTDFTRKRRQIIPYNVEFSLGKIARKRRSKTPFFYEIENSQNSFFIAKKLGEWRRAPRRFGMGYYVIKYGFPLTVYE